MAIRTYGIKIHNLWATIRQFLIVAALGSQLSHKLMAIEPLEGPKIGSGWYLDPAPSKGDKYQVRKSKFVNADIPIPIPLFIAMPFTSLSYDEVNQSLQPHFLSDQRLGIGLLHHPAEGDPSWRLDWTRVGSASSRGLSWLKISANLNKPFPWLKPRLSDQLTAWVAINAIERLRQNVMWIPEFGWKRIGADGLSLDFVAPRYVFLGYQGPKYGLLGGVEQTLKIWSTSDNGFEKEKWSIDRQSVLKLLARPSESILFSISGIRQLPDNNVDAYLGCKITVQWTPNPY